MSSDTDKIVVHRTFLFCVGLRSLKFFNLINFAFLELTRRLERIIYIFEGCFTKARLCRWRLWLQWSAPIEMALLFFWCNTKDDSFVLFAELDHWYFDKHFFVALLKIDVYTMIKTLSFSSRSSWGSDSTSCWRSEKKTWDHAPVQGH